MVKKVIILLFFCLSFSMYSQEGAFSPYSFFGIGNNTFRATAENRSMGGLSVYSDSIHLNLQNPAAYSKLKLTTFSLSATANRLELEEPNFSDDVNYSTIDYVAIGLPLKKFSLGFGLKPLSSVGYNIQTIDDNIARNLEGSGGVNTVYFSGGMKVVKNLSLGITTKYNFGNIENKNIIFQRDIERATRELNTSNVNGFTFNFGIQNDFKINKKYTLRTSLGFSPENSLNIENERQVATIVLGADGEENVIDQGEVLSSNSEITYGSILNAGIGFGQERQWFIGLEYTQQAANDFSAINFNNNIDVRYVDSYRYKIGGFFTPRYNAPRNYLKRITYRAGLRYNLTGLEYKGKEIDEFGISFGLGLPAGRFFTNINVGAEYWKRGTTANDLIRENYFSFFVSLSFNDLWFQKPKYN